MTEYTFDEWNIESCWLNYNDRCSYSLAAKDADSATFRRGDGKVLILTRDEAIRIMRPT